MHPALVAVDWGTTHRHCFVIAADGSMVSRTTDAPGVLAGPDFEAEVARFAEIAGAAPLLLAGMIGSSTGWREVPYVTAPAGLPEIAAGCVQAGPAWVVPGLLYDDDARPDVMRGEEVRILGAMALGFIAEGAGPDLVCLPGTHSKWAETGNARIRRFRTVMTGDILAALKAHSILSDLLAAPAEQTADTEAAFLAGVDHMLEAADLTAELFTVRARVLTGRLDAAGAAAQISGLLIGADIRAGLGRLRTDVVPLIGDAALCNRFALALARAGRETSILDGETAFVAGAMALARHLELAA